jgi:DnaJ-class molecular chaperone
MSDDDHLKATTENPAMVRCEACNGTGARTVTGQGGRMVEQKCTFCDGLGVMTPLALSKWHEYIRAGRLR